MTKHFDKDRPNLFSDFYSNSAPNFARVFLFVTMVVAVVVVHGGWGGGVLCPPAPRLIHLWYYFDAVTDRLSASYRPTIPELIRALIQNCLKCLQWTLISFCRFLGFKHLIRQQHDEDDSDMSMSSDCTVIDFEMDDELIEVDCNAKYPFICAQPAGKLKSYLHL